jgi:hypothetical protein
MTTISSTPKIGYAYDETDDTWYPLVSSGVASHSHSASVIVGLEDELTDITQQIVNPLLLMGA